MIEKPGNLYEIILISQGQTYNGVVSNNFPTSAELVANCEELILGFIEEKKVMSISDLCFVLQDKEIIDSLLDVDYNNEHDPNKFGWVYKDFCDVDNDGTMRLNPEAIKKSDETRTTYIDSKICFYKVFILSLPSYHEIYPEKDKDNSPLYDDVNKPKHYQTEKGIEAIDVIEAFTSDLTGIEATDTGNVLKYMCRWKKKNGLQDLEKARWYLNHLIKKIEEKPEYDLMF